MLVWESALGCPGSKTPVFCIVALPTLRVVRTTEDGSGIRYYRDSCGFKFPARDSSASRRTAPLPSGKDASLHQFFAPGGVLSRTHPAYEFRRGQLQMAQAVEQALEEKRHLIVEAGTGTGKTLAYLMPVIRSGKRVIISTGTKNLQEQLFYKDVPFLEQALYGLPASGSRLSVCYMKGRNNYLCRKKLYDLTDQPVLSGLEEIEQYRAIAAWEKTTGTGDRAELAELPEASLLWHKLDARADACIGQKCSEWERCFITEMRRKAMESDIIIVNHHLFFADLAIKLQADGAPDAGILPEAAAVIFDEAHELEDVAGNYFGISVSNLRMEDLARDVESSLQHNRMLSASLSGALGSLRERSQFFFSLLPPGDGRFAFETRREFLEENGDEFVALNQALTRLAGELEGLPQKPEEVFNFVRRAQEIQVQLGFAMESEDRNTVFWIERRGGRVWIARAGRIKLARHRARGRQNVFLQATPIDVGPILRECLWSKLECAVLTSATLAVGGGFEYIRQRLGLEHARESVLPSHFDYESQALLYVPPDLPDPRTPQFTAQGGGAHSQTAGDHARAGVRSFHQLCADERHLSAAAGRSGVSDAAAGRRAEERAARGVPADAECGAVCDVVVLAGRGRAGRAVELRDHRPAAVCGAERSGGGGASEGDRCRRRQCVLSISGAGGGDHAETGIRTADPLAARSRTAGAAR